MPGIRKMSIIAQITMIKNPKMKPGFTTDSINESIVTKDIIIAEPVLSK
jgi:hypothetical protein